MGWDREQYREDVIKPARQAGNVPPADLYVRYGLPTDLHDPALFAERITEVVEFWRDLTTGHSYDRLAEMLIAEHHALERARRLTLDSFAELHAHARREQMERLTRLADAEAARPPMSGQPRWHAYIRRSAALSQKQRSRWR